jgi:putative tricarboxylic transport membrane protein
MKKGMPFVKNRNDAVAAAIFLLFSVVYGISAEHLPKAHLEEVIEANVYPFVLAVLLAALSLLLLFRSFSARQESASSWLPAKEIVLQILFLFAALAAYILLFRTLGYLSSTLLFMVGTLKFIDRKRSLLNVILLSLFISGICYGLFVILFQIPVPRGLLM